jgi:anti-anti-sigma factor
MSIKIGQKKYRQSIVLHIRGRVAPEDTVRISKKVVSLKRKRFRFAVVDLSDVEYLSSHWIGVFVHSWKELHDLNKRLVFLIPEGFVRNQFFAANLGMVFDIIGSLDELDSLAADSKPEQ